MGRNEDWGYGNIRHVYANKKLPDFDHFTISKNTKIMQDIDYIDYGPKYLLPVYTKISKFYI